MPFSLKQITPPTHEPVSLGEMKDFLRISANDQDGVLGGLITAARVTVEQYTRRAMVYQQWKLVFDKFPGSWPFSYGFGATLLSPYREIHIPICPLSSVDSFQYTDMNTGELVTMVEGTDYQVSMAEPGRLQPGYGQAWPIARWVLDAVQVTFTAGYGDASLSPAVGVDPPETLKLAIKLTVGHFYENRESQEMPPAVKNLIDPYRVWDVSPVLNNWERFGR